MKSNRLFWGLLALATIVYLPTLGFAFVYDDHWTLIGNGFLRSPEDAGLLFSPRGAELHIPDAFRPTSVLFDMVTVQVFGLHPAAHHGLSILLHAAATGFLFGWLRKAGASVPLSTSAAALFATLAIHAEAISVVSFREDLLATALGLAALYLASGTAYLASNARQRSLPLRLVGILVLIALACGAKLSAALLPALWLLVTWLAPFRDRPSKRRIVLVAASLGVGVVCVLALRAFTTGGLSPYGDSPRIFANRVGLDPVLAASTQIHVGYLQQMLIPRGLSPEYADYSASWLAPATMLCALALSLIVGYGIWLAGVRRRPLVAIAILGTALLALPTANIAPMPNMRADRFMYLPSLPLCVGVAAFLLGAGQRLAARYQKSWLSVAPLVAVVIVQGSLARGAAAAYATDGRLWEVAARRSPGSARAQAILGEFLVHRLRREPSAAAAPRLMLRARSACAFATALDPLDDLPWLCTARLATVERDWVRAHAAFSRAVELGGAREERALLALASTELDLPGIPYETRRARAFAHLDRAAAEFPYVAEVFAVRGRLRHRLGDAQGAAADYAHASALHPERWDVILAGLELQLDLGHISAAQRTYENVADQLQDADPTALTAIKRRLQQARKLSVERR